jgi:CheY-like chemotaxis protein
MDLDSTVSKRILVADDEEPIRKIILSVLNMGGYNNITAVDNGQKALDELLGNHYDICITDTFMPERKGYEVIQQYKASPAANGTRFIAMSGNLSEELSRLYSCLGADVITKPFAVVDLLSLVKKYN